MHGGGSDSSERHHQFARRAGAERAVTEEAQPSELRMARLVLQQVASWENATRVVL